MSNNEIKSKIYALVSISVFAISIISFVVFINFMVKIKDLSFALDEKLIEEKTTVLNVDEYNKIKEKIEKNNISVN